MEWIVLGTGTLIPDAERGCAGHVLRGDGVAALFDAGSGTKDRLARAGVAFNQLTHLFFSHEHLDHWADLLSLLFYRANTSKTARREGQVIVGPPGFTDLVHAVAGAADPDLLDKNEDLRWIEQRPGERIDGGWFRASAWPMSHGNRAALGWRVQGGRGGERWSVAYTGDTGPCDSLEEMARGVSCLVSECARPESSKARGHMTPESLRRVADACRPRTVVLTHLYPDVLQGGAIEAAFKGYEGQMVIAHDGMRIWLGPEGMGKLP